MQIIILASIKTETAQTLAMTSCAHARLDTQGNDVKLVSNTWERDRGNLILYGMRLYHFEGYMFYKSI